MPGINSVTHRFDSVGFEILNFAHGKLVLYICAGRARRSEREQESARERERERESARESESARERARERARESE